MDNVSTIILVILASIFSFFIGWEQGIRDADRVKLKRQLKKEKKENEQTIR